MFLRSLTMRGFKSFADRTALEVEPGITVIVGPNGSGKSNVVDALAWVLGTNSAKKVRGGAMSDVVFAGSPTRPRGREARVEISIDNTDGRLQAGSLGTAASAGEFREVRVARTIDADGGSGYEINGTEVRALDVQELLSDTGLGRELHTIVGQGQLDEILNAKPEERRRYIEEAAGILKHRRRRERAIRKLEQVEGHIDKLRTVLRELRRQLRPLERQAEAADRHQQLQAEVRSVGMQLAAAELAELRTAAATQGDADRSTADQHRELEARLATLERQRSTLQRERDELTPRAETAVQTYHRLVSLTERSRGTADLIEAKRRHLVEYVEEPLAGRPPAELRTQADRLVADAAAKQADRDREREALDAATAARREAEQARRAHEQQRHLERRRRAEARERVLRWEGEVQALRGGVASTEGELARVTQSLAGLDDRVAEADQEVAAVQDEITSLDAAEVELTAALEAAEARVAEADGRVEQLTADARELDAARASALARAEALRAALAETEGGAAALLDRGLDGVLGPVATLVRSDAAHDATLAAALGPLGEAVAVSTPNAARASIAWLREVDAGTAVVLPARADARELPGPDASQRAELDDAGARPVAELLSPADADGAHDVVTALQRALAGTWRAPDWATAVLLHGRHPQLTFVTPDGDVAGPYGFRGGASPERSAVVTATAAADSEARAEQLAEELAATARAREEADAELTQAKAELAAATERINESDARITGAAERLARLHKELHSLSNQREVVAGTELELTEALARDQQALERLVERGPQVDDEPDELDDGPDEVAIELDDAVERARERELDARVRLERATEQVRHLELQAESLRQEAEEVEASLAEAARRREARRLGIARCGELAVVARTVIDGLQRATSEAAQERDRLQAEVAERRQALGQLREQITAVTAELDELREQRHAADLHRADVERRLEQLAERLRERFSVTADELAADHPDAAGYDRDALAEREDVLVRKLGLLGRVNPLALEEFKALEERHAFLSDQLDDLRRSKRDLEQVVVQVDERIRAVFSEAFDDVAAEFELTFQTVFPGGAGRLVLTDPDDLLTTGIEVEARPPGKRVTRLSLLSGGERSLTVLAFVFAIFRARPSPFYVLDEVDAALDDVNLQRLLKVVRSFRGHAQIIMVTHQKRSMEIADVLYGVTMGPDAVTKVVAERLRDEPRADEALEERASDAPTEAVASS